MENWSVSITDRNYQELKEPKRSTIKKILLDSNLPTQEALNFLPNKKSNDTREGNLSAHTSRFVTK